MADADPDDLAKQIVSFLEPYDDETLSAVLQRLVVDVPGAAKEIGWDLWRFERRVQRGDERRAIAESAGVPLMYRRDQKPPPAGATYGRRRFFFRFQLPRWVKELGL